MKNTTLLTRLKYASIIIAFLLTIYVVYDLATMFDEVHVQTDVVTKALKEAKEKVN